MGVLYAKDHVGGGAYSGVGLGSDFAGSWLIAAELGAEHRIRRRAQPSRQGGRISRCEPGPRVATDTKSVAPRRPVPLGDRHHGLCPLRTRRLRHLRCQKMKSRRTLYWDRRRPA